VLLTVAGVIDIPDADAFFPGVRLPSQAAPQAPPDNVILLPAADWHRIFDAQTR
jgi:putative ABC transport system permease protein